MQLVHLLITIWCVTSRVKSQNFQTQNPYVYQPTAKNMQSDRLYFNDNRPVNNVPVGQNAGTAGKQENFLVQQQVKPVLADNFQTANSFPQSYPQQPVNRNPNDRNAPIQSVYRPILSLQPPMIDHERYYPSVSEELNTSLKHGDGDDEIAIQNGTEQITANLAVTSFSLKLFKNMDHSTGRNLVVSPYSIGNVLALLEQGAVDESLRQLVNALQMSPQFASMTYKTLTDDVKKRDTSNNILKLANNIFVAPAFSLNPTFKSIAINNFGSEVTSTNFANSNEAVRRINSWVASKTNNNIKEILSSDSVDGNVQLVLVNAIFFKGLWLGKFDKALTTPGPFFIGGSGAKTVSYMHIRRPYKVGFDRRIDARILILPFEREQYSLMIILPTHRTSVPAVLSGLGDSYLQDYHDMLSVKEVELALPKFTIKTDTDLTPIFMKMGIRNIFHPISGLSGVGLYQTSSPQVSTAVHCALLSIDEQGGTAAAATAVVAVALSNDDSTVRFEVDRPFIAVLWDNRLKMPLFIANINDPSLN